jgi:hypothetical protein
LCGEVNDWILKLTTDIDGYLAALQKSAFAGTAYCQEYALQTGGPIWGFKYLAGHPPPYINACLYAGFAFHRLFCAALYSVRRNDLFEIGQSAAPDGDRAGRA